MDTTVQHAAITVRTQVLAAEGAANRAAEETARLIATLLGQRAQLNRPINVGASEVERAHQALGRSLGTLRCLAMMHGGLHAIADSEGVDFGTSESVPNTPGGYLRVA